MKEIVYLALFDDGRIVAQFLNGDDAEKFCREKDLCMMPFNLSNSDCAPCPPVGSVYRA